MQLRESFVLVKRDEGAWRKGERYDGREAENQRDERRLYILPYNCILVSTTF